MLEVPPLTAALRLNICSGKMNSVKLKASKVAAARDLTVAVTSPHTEKFVYAVLRLLRPVARLILGHMTGTLLLDLMRRVLVEEAWSKLNKDKEGKVTLSEVALLTGMDSRMLKQLMNTPLRCTEAEISREAMVMNRWQSDPEFVDPQTGKAKLLLIFGRGATLQGLVSSVAGRNVTVQTVLDRLISNGNVEIFDGHWVRLISDHLYVFKKGTEKLMEEGTDALQRLAYTVEHNLSCDGASAEKHFHRLLGTLRLTPTQAEKMRERLQRLLREQSAVADEMIDQPVEELVAQAEPFKVGVGYFYWEEECHPTQKSGP